MNRIAILFDVNELYHSVGKLYPGKKFNYAQFITRQQETGDVYHAAACIDTALDKGRNFVAMLKANGYVVRIGDRKVLFAVEAMSLENQVDCYIFGTGSEAYTPLFDYLMKRGKQVWLISPNIKPAKFDVTGILALENEYLF